MKSQTISSQMTVKQSLEADVEYSQTPEGIAVTRQAYERGELHKGAKDWSKPFGRLIGQSSYVAHLC